MRPSTLAQVGFGIEAVELGAFNKRVDRGGALAAGIGAGEQIILPAEGERTNRALCQFWAWVTPSWAVGAAICGAEPSVERSVADRRAAA
jgi:hypothetical protein